MMRLAGSDVVEQKMLNTGQVVSEAQLQAAKADIAMTVFCPGYVQTNLDKSESYRPERFKEESDPYYQSEEYKMGIEEFNRVIESGYPLEGHGEMVFKAIEEDQFYVIPHEKYDDFLKLQTSEKLQRKSPNLAEVVAAIKAKKEAAAAAAAAAQNQ